MVEMKINPHIAQYTVVVTGRLLATFSLLQGLNIIVGGPDRWAGRSFAVALLLPGAPPTWGVILFLFGLISMYGSIRGRFTPVVVGSFGSAVWCAFFTLSMGITALSDRLAATTGVFTYGALAILFVLVGVAYKESRKQRS